MKCEVIEIITPKKYILKGLWFGGEKPKRALVFVHGLTSSPFSHHDYLTPLASKDTAVVFFGNRGSEIIAKFRRIDKRKKYGYISEFIGEAHETFTDCFDDIQGAVNFLKSRGVKDVYLIGHSTGCQKAVYYLSRPGKQKLIAGAVLLCPISDWAYAKKYEKPEILKKATEHARKLVKQNKSHFLLPEEVYYETMDAQRFLSLYAPESIENQIFPYFDPKNKAKTLKSVKIPLLIVLAEKDEYRDRSTRELVKWFSKKGRNRKFTTVSLPGASHGFNNQEIELSRQINTWLKTNEN